MPRINYKLATQRANTGGSPGGISAPQINSGVGAQLKAMSVNPNAANVQFTGTQPNKIVTSNTILEAANAGRVISQAAFDFSERQAVADADSAVLRYKNETVNAFYGSTDSEGNNISGFNATQSNEALDNAKGYIDRINAGYSGAVAALSPSARSKAILRLGADRNRALLLGAKHQATQMKVREDELAYENRQKIKSLVERTGIDIYEDGTFDEHIASIEGQEKQEAAANDIITYTIAEAYDQQLAKEPKEPLKAQANAEAILEQIKGKLNSPDRSKLEASVAKWRVETEKAAKEGYESALKRFRKEEGLQVTKENISSITSNNYDFIRSNVSRIRAANTDIEYPDSEVSKLRVTEAVVSTTVDSIVGVAKENNKLPTPENKINRMNLILDTLMEKDSMFTNTERILIGEGIKKANDAVIENQNRENRVNNFILSSEMWASRKARESWKVKPAPKGMTGEQEENWYMGQAAFSREMMMEKTDDELKKDQGVHEYYKVKEINGDVSKEDVDKAWVAYTRNDIPLKEFRAVNKAYMALQDPDYEKEAYRKTPDYNWAKDYLTASLHGGFFMKDSGIDEDSAQYEAENKMRYNRALVDMDAEALRREVDGKRLEYEQWVGKFVKDYDGSATDVTGNMMGIIKTLPQGFQRTITGIPRGIYHSMTGKHPSVMEGVEKKRLDIERDRAMEEAMNAPLGEKSWAPTQAVEEYDAGSGFEPYTTD